MGNTIRKRVKKFWSHSQLGIPDHIAIDVLSRLPVKDILRFRCVCKSWGDMALDPDFVNLHMRRAESSVLVNFHIKEDSAPLGRSSGYRLISSCNGLLVIQTQGGSYHLWNSATHKIISLPEPPVSWEKMRLYHIPVTGEYKLVYSYHDKEDEFSSLGILTIGGTWRQIAYEWDCDDESECKWFFAEDAPHLLELDIPSRTCHISSFDVESEQPIHIDILKEMNDLLEKKFLRNELSGWPGHFATCFYSKDKIIIFVLEDYNRSKWVKKEIAHFGKIVPSKGFMGLSDAFSYHGLTHDGVMWFKGDRDDALMSYNMETQEKKYFNFDFQNNKIEASFFTYLPTLVKCAGM